MSEYHEPYEILSPEVRDAHRALLSLKEELEAVDWYGQRIDACTDPDLRAVLIHSRDEEVEHACNTLEWLRRTSSIWDAQLKKRLFREGPIILPEHGTERAGQTVVTLPQRPGLAAGMGVGKGVTR